MPAIDQVWDAGMPVYRLDMDAQAQGASGAVTGCQPDWYAEKIDTALTVLSSRRSKAGTRVVAAKQEFAQL